MEILNRAHSESARSYSSPRSANIYGFQANSSYDDLAEQRKSELYFVNTPAKTERLVSTNSSPRPLYKRVRSAPLSRKSFVQMDNKVYEIKLSMLLNRGQDEYGNNLPDVIRSSDALQEENQEGKDEYEITYNRNQNGWDIHEAIDGAHLRIIKEYNKLNFLFVVNNRTYKFPFAAIESEDADLWMVPLKLRDLFTTVFLAGNEKDIRTLVLIYREYLIPDEFVTILDNIYRYSKEKTKKIVGRVLSCWLECWEYRDQLMVQDWYQEYRTAPKWFQDLTSQSKLEVRKFLLSETNSEEIKTAFDLSETSFQEARSYFMIADYLGLTDLSRKVKLPWEGVVVRQHFEENKKGIEKLSKLIAQLKTSWFSATELYKDVMVPADSVKWPVNGLVCERCLGLPGKKGYLQSTIGISQQDYIWVDKVSRIIIRLSDMGKQIIQSISSSGSLVEVSRGLTKNHRNDRKLTEKQKREVEEQLNTYQKVIEIVRNQFPAVSMNDIRKEIGDHFTLKLSNVNKVVNVLCDREDMMSLFKETWSPNQIAMALTYIEFSYLSHIQIGETLSENYKEKNFPTSPNWRRWSIYSKNLSTWVTYQIIICKDSQTAAQKIEVFARIADKCLAIRNWNAAFFILANLKHYQNQEYRAIWRQLGVRTLSMLTILEEAFNNMHGERKRKRLGNCKSAPVSRTLRDLKDTNSVGVVPIFYVLNRYATMTEKWPRTINGKINTERYEEEWNLYDETIGRHRDRNKWEKLLGSSFPSNSMAVCKALACRLEEEILKCKQFRYSERRPCSGVSKLYMAEEEFKERVVPKTKWFHINQNYTRAVLILVAVLSHYMIIRKWYFHFSVSWFGLGLAILVLPGIVHIWLLLQVERNVDVTCEAHFNLTHCQSAHCPKSESNLLTRVSSLGFWFEAVVSLMGLSILLATWRVKLRAHQREDWWAEGRGEIFEFSRCVAIYTFFQFFFILCATVYMLEWIDGWFLDDCFYFMLLIAFSIIWNITVMFKTFYESILKYNNYAHFVISLDRWTDSAIRIFSVCLVLTDYGQMEQWWVCYLTFAAVYLYEFTYVFIAFCLTKSEVKYRSHTDIDFHGNARYIFAQALLLMYTEIAYHIPISGFATRYPRFEAVLRHLISSGLVFWYVWISQDVDRWIKVSVFFSLLVVHYLSFALFKKLLKPYEQAHGLYNNSSGSTSQRGRSSNRLLLFPVKEEINTASVRLSPKKCGSITTTNKHSPLSLSKNPTT